jgi:hypothetical protein
MPKKETGNGCYLDTCDKFAESRCLDERDTVSQIDGQPMCPHHPLAVTRKEWAQWKEAGRRSVAPGEMYRITRS